MKPGWTLSGLAPACTPALPDPLPDKVVTSKSREKSSGHCRRAASTTCSCTAPGTARF